MTDPPAATQAWTAEKKATAEEARAAQLGEKTQPRGAPTRPPVGLSVWRACFRTPNTARPSSGGRRERRADGPTDRRRPAAGGGDREAHGGLSVPPGAAEALTRP
jgi:hypothetical protein